MKGQKEEKKEKEREEKDVRKNSCVLVDQPWVLQEVLVDLNSLLLHILIGFLGIKRLC